VTTKHPPLAPTLLCASLLRAFSSLAVPAMTLALPLHTGLADAGQAQGSLAVSLQVLPVCRTVVNPASATVHCPPEYPYSVTRSQVLQAEPDAQPNPRTGAPSFTVNQTVTIRY